MNLSNSEKDVGEFNMSIVEKIRQIFRPPEYGVWLDFEKRETKQLDEINKGKALEWLLILQTKHQAKEDAIYLQKVNLEIIELMKRSRCHPNIMAYLGIDMLRRYTIVPLLSLIKPSNISSIADITHQHLEIIRMIDSKLHKEWTDRVTRVFCENGYSFEDSKTKH